MQRIACLLCAIVVLGGTPVRPAAAMGGEVLGCYFSTHAGQGEPYSTGSCFPDRPLFQYNLVFRVLNKSSNYSYAWDTISGSGLTVISGCSPNVDFCTVNAVTSSGADYILHGAVTITDLATGQAATLPVNAWVPCVTRFVNGQPAYC